MDFIVRKDRTTTIERDCCINFTFLLQLMGDLVQ